MFISKELHDLSQINFSRKCLQQKRTKNPSCSSNKPLLYSCITNYLLVGALWTVIPSYILTKIVTFFPWPTDDLFLVPVFYQYNEIRKHYFFSCSYVSPKRSWLLINAAMGRLTKRSRASRWKAWYAVNVKNNKLNILSVVHVFARNLRAECASA